MNKYILSPMERQAYELGVKDHNSTAQLHSQFETHMIKRYSDAYKQGLSKGY